MDHSNTVLVRYSDVDCTVNIQILDRPDFECSFVRTLFVSGFWMALAAILLKTIQEPDKIGHKR
jgi:hypothetical protein